MRRLLILRSLLNDRIRGMNYGEMGTWNVRKVHRDDRGVRKVRYGVDGHRSYRQVHRMDLAGMNTVRGGTDDFQHR